MPDPDKLFALFISAGLLLELVLIYKPFIEKLHVTSGAAIFLNMFAVGLFASENLNLYGLIFVLISFYKTANLLRIIELRMNPEYLAKVFRRSAIFLIIYQLLTVLVWWLSKNQLLPKIDWSIGWFGFVIIIAAGLLINILLQLKKSSNNSVVTSDSKLKQPTVSVLIPARNETQDMSDCIESLLQSSYEKLEIIVLDDCSRDKTPEIIRAYANKGVRFIAGKEMPKRWLAKNYAYSQLAEEASGSILLFMGVDVRFRPESIEILVHEFIQKKLIMMSVLPKRRGQSKLGVVVQPMRYWFQLAIPNFIKKHPPVLSTCWLIDHAKFKSYGGFEAATRTIVAENYFSQKANNDGGYYFRRTHHDTTVTTIKGVREQIDTAIRNRYPEIKKRPEALLVLSLFELLVLFGPYFVTIYGLFFYVNPSVWWLAFISTWLLSAGHIVVTVLANPGTWILSTISFPLIVLVEFCLAHISMYKYEFGKVEWKGRNICLPVMHVTSSLPKIK